MVSPMTLLRAPRSQRGVTAVELLIVIVILGILAAFAAPSMSRFLQTQKVRSLAYDLFADLAFARSEAISRGHSITIQSVDGTDWNQGWTINDVTASPNVQLRVYGQCTGPTPPSPCVLAQGVTFLADQASVTFDRSGRTGAAIVSFNIAPTDVSATADQKRCVKLDMSGRPKSAPGVC